jgi:hypothetical protein
MCLALERHRRAALETDTPVPPLAPANEADGGDGEQHHHRAGDDADDDSGLELRLFFFVLQKLCWVDNLNLVGGKDCIIEAKGHSRGWLLTASRLQGNKNCKKQSC